jgi:hypothetical protein
MTDCGVDTSPPNPEPLAAVGVLLALGVLVATGSLQQFGAANWPFLVAHVAGLCPDA